MGIATINPPRFTVVSGTYTGDGDVSGQQINVVGMRNAQFCIIVPYYGSTPTTNMMAFLFAGTNQNDNQQIDGSGGAGTTVVYWIDQLGGVGGRGFSVRTEDNFNNPGQTYRYCIWGTG